MRVKRLIFIFILMILTCVCFYQMNQHYDELARYPYPLNDQERELVLEKFNTEEINELVSQQIKPNQFLPYISIDGFMLSNTLWYDKAIKTQDETKAYIVSFINKYKDRMEYGSLEDLLKNYTYNELTRFYDEGNEYTDANLIADTNKPLLRMKSNETIYTFEPSQLVSLNDIPHDALNDKNDILIQSVVKKPLKNLLQALSEVNHKKYGGLKLSAGYLSYEDQVNLYEEYYEIYKDDTLKYFDYPGQNEFQLGYSLRFICDLKEDKKKDDEDIIEKEDQTEKKDNPLIQSTDLNKPQQEVASWLKENAYRYGFIVRYPQDQEDITNKEYQPFILRYVGTKIAKQMQDQNLVLEDISIDAIDKLN